MRLALCLLALLASAAGCKSVLPYVASDQPAGDAAVTDGPPGEVPATPDAETADADDPCACRIADRCYRAGDGDPDDACHVCDPRVSRAGWGPAPGCVVTLAGGEPGFVDGPAGQARFEGPIAIAVGSDGTVYVGDWSNHRLRELTVHGQVRTAVGNGEPLLVDGTAGPTGTARVSTPMGVAVTPDLVVFSSKNDHAVRVLQDGMVKTLAGDGNPGGRDGPADVARLDGPQGVAVDGKGAIYVADGYNNRIRVIDGDAVQTFAGDGTAGSRDGPAASARFSFPTGVAVGSGGLVYVADEGNQRIRVVEAGTVHTVAGGSEGFADGALADARFRGPHSLAVDEQGRVYVGDTGNNRIRVIEGQQVTTLVGGEWGFADGPLSKAALRVPLAVAIGPYGHVYFCDGSNAAVRVLALPK